MAGNPNWRKGVSGNPKGRPKGRRDRITEAFLRDLEEAWRRSGSVVIDRAAAEEPMQFCAMIAKLLPKQHILDVGETLADALVRLSARQGDPALPGEPDGLRDGGVAGHA